MPTKLPVKAFVIFTCLFFLFSQKDTYAQVTPVQLYQANPKAYTYGTYSNNKDPYGIEVYSCANPDDLVPYDKRHDACIPTRQSIQNLYFWSYNVNAPPANNPCAVTQATADGPEKSADTRTMNGTGQPDSALQMCPAGDGTNGPSFIDVTKSFTYDSSYCSNGEAMVLASRQDPSNPACVDLNVDDMLANPQNYSANQRACLLYVDDEARVDACLNGKCSSHIYSSPEIKGGNLIPSTETENLCSIFNHGNGTYNVRLQAYDTKQNMYGSSSFWLTGLTNGATYTVSGHVFNDSNKNGKQDAGEPDYTGPITITSSKGTVSTNGGSYTINGIPQGSVTVSFPNLPAGYYMTSPLNGPPPSFAVTVGPGCTVNGAPGAVCNAGNIINLNFGTTNTHPWFQATCGDVRNDNGITDLLPVGQLANITNASCTNAALSYTGDTSSNYGNGQDSATNQETGGSAYPEVFSGASALSTSYTSLLAKTQSAGITPTALSSVCTLSNCNLPNGLGNFPHGIYQATGANNTPINVTLNGYNFKNNTNYIFLINGNLTITGPLTVPNGSTVLFATTGNIVVSSAIGTAATSTTSNLDGWYIAGKNFIVNSAGTCNDLRLNIAGAVVANASGTGGTIQNNRDLCGSDTTYPTISFTQRLDMILNAPQFLAQQLTISQEIAP